MKAVQLKRITLFQFLLPAIFQTGAFAQRVQNMDIYFLAGPASVGSHRLPGSNVTVSGSTGPAICIGYGYQFLRTSAGSLWVEFMPMVFSFPGKLTADIPGFAPTNSYTATPGLRLMVPIQSRLSLYGTIGGGYGSFDYPVIWSGPRLSHQHTRHGVFSMGGGVDVRLSRLVSIRGEVRDFVTGTGLSGAAGRHHLRPLMGLASTSN